MNSFRLSFDISFALLNFAGIAGSYGVEGSWTWFVHFVLGFWFVFLVVDNIKKNWRNNA